jgi:hypothetical protein
MAFFSKKPDPVPVEPTPEEKAAAARALLIQKLEKALATEPAFKVMTVDGINWICPYTGTLVSAAFGYIEPAREYLVAAQPWLKAKPKTADELLTYRWVLHLKNSLEMEPNLRIFSGDGRWLNPFTGLYVKLSRKDQSITEEMIQELAGILAKTPQAQTGRMLDRAKLEDAQKTPKFHSGNYSPMEEGLTATTRVSGSRAGATTSVVKRTIEDDMDKAQSILEKMLPPPPAIPGFGFIVHYEPHAQVGGDFYEITELEPGKFFIALADVTGHGVQGAMVVVAALKALRFILKQEKSLVEVLARLNDEVKADLLSGQFITMFAGILDLSSTTFTCVCAGHHATLLASVKRRTVLEQVGNKGAALGLMKGDIFKRTLKPLTLKLEPGDTLLMYTDGLTEVHNSKGVEYGEYRMFGSLVSSLEDPYDQVVRRVVGEARHFAQGVLEDDVTVMSLSMELPKEEEGEAEGSG